MTLRSFEAALLGLEQAPLATEGLRAALAREREALSSSLNPLTSFHEHSMQALLG